MIWVPPADSTGGAPIADMADPPPAPNLSLLLRLNPVPLLPFPVTEGPSTAPQHAANPGALRAMLEDPAVLAGVAQALAGANVGFLCVGAQHGTCPTFKTGARLTIRAAWAPPQAATHGRGGSCAAGRA